MRKTVYTYLKDGVQVVEETDHAFPTQEAFDFHMAAKANELAQQGITAKDFVFICTINYKLK